MYLDKKSGAVVISESKCIRCLACVEACPFGAIHIGPDREILKCDLCGGEPVCAKYCPPRPGYVLPHLPWPAPSCLQFIPPDKIRANREPAPAEKG